MQVLVREFGSVDAAMGNGPRVSNPHAAGLLAMMGGQLPGAQVSCYTKKYTVFSCFLMVYLNGSSRRRCRFPATWWVAASAREAPRSGSCR